MYKSLCVTVKIREVIGCKVRALFIRIHQKHMLRRMTIFLWCV